MGLAGGDDDGAEMHSGVIHTVVRWRFLLWLGVMAGLMTLLVLLSVYIKDNPLPSQDQTVLDWITGWDFPGLTGFLEAVSWLTNNYPALVLGILGIGFLWLLGMNREALAFAVIGVVMGLIAFLSDFTLGEIIGRSRPLGESDGPSFPSGHVFGSTVFFGFWGFMAAYYGLKKKLLVPLLLLITVFILTVGVARVHLQAHWPTDVAAGLLLGAMGLLILIPLFLYLRQATWFSPWKLREDLTVLGCEKCRTEKSIASVVVLDPERGTATKVYNPPPVIRLLYWLAFQAKFPYTDNRVALEAAAHRRKIASLLTIHRFGRDLVAPVTAISCMHGSCSFVTEFVPGDKVENDDEARSFLTQVADIFAEAGLSVWQINPRNPHAQSNLIRTPQGEFKIIDLESAVVTLIPARGQWRSSLKRGSIPVFDDIDFPRARDYIASNETALERSLGPQGLIDLRESVEHAERAIRAWKDAEPHLWGRLVSRVYRLLDVKTNVQHIMGAMQGADAAADAFLNRGMARWEVEGRLTSSEVARLQTYLSSGEVRNALHHMGVHMVLSVVIAIPIPGLRSASRFTWTLAFWVKTWIRRPRRRAAEGAPKPTNIHSPLVMLLALVPILGAVAYLASRPLRQSILIRLIMDETAWRLPFKLYPRLHLARWLARAPQLLEIPAPVKQAAAASQSVDAPEE